MQAGLASAAAKLSDSTPRAGQTITVITGTWKPTGVSFGYQWLRNGVAIDNATEARYTVTAADRGKKLTARIAGSLDSYPSVTRTTSSSSKVR